MFLVWTLFTYACVSEELPISPRQPTSIGTVK